MNLGTPKTRELAARTSDGVHVVLLWHPLSGSVTVSVEDERAGDRFRIAVAPERALDAFYHPFAYAAEGLDHLERRNEHVPQHA
jgi:hypothetical protein